MVWVYFEWDAATRTHIRWIWDETSQTLIRQPRPPPPIERVAANVAQCRDADDRFRANSNKQHGKRKPRQSEYGEVYAARANGTKSAQKEQYGQFSSPRDGRLRARQLLTEKLSVGPRRAVEIETAAHAHRIKQSDLLDAADDLQLISQHGQWRLP